MKKITASLLLIFMLAFSLTSHAADVGAQIKEAVETAVVDTAVVVDGIVDKITGKTDVLTSNTMRVAAYNIAYGRGNDRGGLNEVGGKANCLTGVARLLRNQGVDIAGITEISCADLRGGLTDQPAIIAKYSGLNNYKYGENHRFGLVVIGMGNAVFSRFPITWSENHKLYKEKEENEQRGCLEALIDLGGKKGKVRIFVAHLGLSQGESVPQLKQIWDIIKTRSEPCILMGDFNSSMGSAGIKFMTQNMTNVSAESGGTYWPKSRQTANAAKEKLDYIFTNKTLNLVEKSCKVTGFTEGYSDHGCLLADLTTPDK